MSKETGLFDGKRLKNPVLTRSGGISCFYEEHFVIQHVELTSATKTERETFISWKEFSLRAQTSGARRQPLKAD